MPATNATAANGFCWKRERNIERILYVPEGVRKAEESSVEKVALVASRGRHRDVVAGVGGVFGQLRSQDPCGVRYLSQLGDTSRHGRLRTHFAFHVPH